MDQCAERDLPFDFQTVDNGEDALRFVLSRRPDLIILDLGLPRKSGLEVLEELWEDSLCEAVPVVVLTSSNRPEDRTASLRYGAKRYLIKPHILSEYENILDDILESI